MELQDQLEQLEQQGLGVVAISYDSEEVLADFAPAFLESILSGNLVLFRLPEHNEMLVAGLLKADVKR